MASILYITRDIERTLGKTPGEDYYVVTNKTPYAEEVQKCYPDFVFLVESEKILSTLELLQHSQVREIIEEYKFPIVVFKNNLQIEELCKDKGWLLLNPSAELAEKVENKITQVDWLGELENLLPPHEIKITKDIVWNKKAFILQWAHGHTGSSTVLVQNEKDLKALQEKFPQREARVTDFIKGPMLTSNIVVTKHALLLGNISYQITGILPFTENPLSTIGNDWSLPHTILSEAQLGQFSSIAKKVGQKMQVSGWKGLFGIDVIYDEERNLMYLIEINARQPASTSYESILQATFDLKGLTTFQAHLDVLSETTIDSSLIQINDGSQILQRVTSQIKKLSTAKLKKAGYKVISYGNEKVNEDLLRIQSSRGIMETHNKFNLRGKDILELLE